MKCPTVLLRCGVAAMAGLGLAYVDSTARTVYLGAIAGPSCAVGSYDDANLFVDSNFRSRMRLGVAAGAMARVEVTRSVFLDTGILYGTRGGTVQESIRGRETQYTISWNLNYITVPCMVGTYLGNVARTKAYGKLGMEIDLATSSTIQQEEMRFNADTAGQDFGAAVALGLIRTWDSVSVLGEIVGTFGLTDVSDAEGAIADVEFRNRTIRVFLGILM